ncbi:MAG: cyclic nucleotide-binding domain-containing protein [bacterium]
MKKQIYINYFWNLIITVAATFLAVILPLKIVLESSFANFYDEYVFYIKIIFACDIIYNIIKYKYFKREFDFEQQYLVVNYIKTWFVLDFITLLVLVFHVSIFHLELLGLLKLIKVIDYMHHLKEREVKFTNELTLVFFIYWIANFAHWISCFWLALKGFNYNYDVTTNYIRSIYWCITTLTTIGYGDITPTNNAQMIFTMFVQLLGAGVFGYLIGSIAIIVSKKDPAKVNYLKNMDKLSTLIKYRKIPPVLQNKMREYYTYVWKQRLGYNETLILEGLPASLKTDLSFNLKKDVLEKIPLFNEAPDEFIKEIAQHIFPVVVMPGDYVFKTDEEGHEMYFVLSGELMILDKEEKQIIANLREGDYFGEIALFKNIPRTATVKAIKYCDLYTLKKKQFDYTLLKFPDIAKKIEQKVNGIENNN